MTRPYKRRKIRIPKHSADWRKMKREQMRRYRENKRNKEKQKKEDDGVGL